MGIYHLQKDAIERLCTENKDMSDDLLKIAALNDFYNTNIFSIFSAAKHILSLGIDDQLRLAI